VKVTCVIPGKDCIAFLDDCLGALTPLLKGPHLADIIFVDDGSSDGSGDCARGHGVTVVRGPGLGPGRARNLGWAEAGTELVWFVDSDCVAESDALDLLVTRLTESDFAAVGGSYGNMRPDKLLSCLIHEEIIERHLQMSREVDFLGTFNALYRRDVLEQVGGFDPRFMNEEDVELAFRVGEAGHRLGFEVRSQVKHYHPDTLWPYLRVQNEHGYWRAWLYDAYPDRATGDSYSGFVDHVQPPLGLAAALASPLLITGAPGLALEGALFTALLACQVPMTQRMIQRTGDLRYLAFAPLSVARAVFRGVGFAHGVAEVSVERLRRARASGP
jgi:glycosyltransferase involved in cell wall biosynthesis